MNRYNFFAKIFSHYNIYLEIKKRILFTFNNLLAYLLNTDESNHQYWKLTFEMYISQPSLFPNPRKTTKTKWNQYINLFVKLCLSFNSHSKVYKRNIQMHFDQQPPLINFLNHSMPWIKYNSLSIMLRIWPPNPNPFPTKKTHT